ncbi:spermidine synthase [Paenibacillus tarimensis]
MSELKISSCSLRKYISRDEEPEGKYRILRKIKTPWQRIAVVKVIKGPVLIYGDGYVMFGTTEDDEMWAESMVHIPMSVAKKPERVLLIGGAGGILAREALRYKNVKEITAVDADRVMMNLGKKLKPLVRFNKGALNNPKVRTVVKDGRAFVEKSRKKWDVICIDIPEPSLDSPGLSRLFSLEFYRLLKSHLKPGGVISIASSVLSVMPEYCGTIIKTLKKAGLHVLPYHLDVRKKYEEDWGYCLASNRPISRNEVKMKVRTKFMNRARLKDMFRIPAKYKRKWVNNKIQTDRNKVLAIIHERNDS